MPLKKKFDIGDRVMFRTKGKNFLPGTVQFCSEDMYVILTDEGRHCSRFQRDVRGGKDYYLKKFSDELQGR